MQASESTTASRKQLIYACAGLVLAVLVAYGPTLSSDFVRLDDPQYVMNNQLVRNPSFHSIARFFSEVRKPSSVAGYYQPLTMVSLMLDALVTGHGDVDPGVAHFHNILLHAASCVLLMLLLRDVVGGLAIPLIVSLLFAVHPVNVEAVSWVSQRKTVLATPLALGCLLCYLRYGRSGRLGLLAASVGLYLLSNLAKPTVVLLPLVLPFLDYWPLKRRVARCLPEKWPFAIVMAVMAYIAFISQASSIATLGVPNLASGRLLFMWAALLSYNLTLYLGNIFWPLYLSPYRPVPDSLGFSNPAIFLSLILIAAVICTWVLSRRRYPPLFVGFSAFAITLLPALGPVRYFDSCVSDRFVYFPFIFLLLTAAAAIADIERLAVEHRTRLLRYAVCLLMLPLLILMRAHQRVWQNSITFWTHVEDAVPDYGIAQIMLGICYADQEMFEEAERHARKGLELRPADGDAVSLLGRVMTQQGHAADAVKFLRDELGKPLVPDAGPTDLSLAEALAVTGDLDGAKDALAKAVKLGCNAASAYERVGDTALKKGKRFEFAAWAYRAAIRENPENLTARWNLGTALEGLGDEAGALAAYEDALKRYEKVGRPSDAMRGAVTSLRLKIQESTTSRPVRGQGS
ncbi:MAG TPA: tetratricopeptide repeat protein [Phycisphaerae bacterium]|nr:tetratricopeptide repeat protein [Phycisphaerae bacterium]